MEYLMLFLFFTGYGVRIVFIQQLTKRRAILFHFRFFSDFLGLLRGGVVRGGRVVREHDVLDFPNDVRMGGGNLT